MITQEQLTKYFNSIDGNAQYEYHWKIRYFFNRITIGVKEGKEYIKSLLECKEEVKAELPNKVKENIRKAENKAKLIEQNLAKAQAQAKIEDKERSDLEEEDEEGEEEKESYKSFE